MIEAPVNPYKLAERESLPHVHEARAGFFAALCDDEEQKGIKRRDGKIRVSLNRTPGILDLDIVWIKDDKSVLKFSLEEGWDVLTHTKSYDISLTTGHIGYSERFKMEVIFSDKDVEVGRILPPFTRERFQEVFKEALV